MLKHTIIIAALLATAPIAGAQLKKEIVVERDIEPAERAATRPATLSPDIYAPKIQTHRLQMAEYSGQGEVSKQMYTLGAARWRDTIATSPYRAYVAGGYFPLFNAAISAGTRMSESKHHYLDAWLQYNGYSYKQDADIPLLAPDDAEKTTLKRHQFAVGLDFEYNFAGRGVLDADIRAMIGTYSHPAAFDTKDQTVSAGKIRVGWQSLSARTPWHVGGHFGIFNFDKAIPEHFLGGEADPKSIKAAEERTFGLSAGIGRNFGPSQWVVDIDARFQNLNSQGHFLMYNNPAHATIFEQNGSVTQGVTRINPHYSFAPANIRLNLGANLDIATGGCNTGLYVTPDVSAVWDVTRQFAVSARVGGGKTLNTLEDIYEYTPYVYGSMTYGRSKVPFDASLKLSVGPFKGFTAELYGGYAKAQNWYVPAMSYSLNGASFLHATTVKGFRYGLQLAYTHRVFDISLAAEGAPNNSGHGYYRWRDNARWNIKASVAVRPFEKLEIHAAWNLRTKRHALQLNSYAPGSSADSPVLWSADRYNLGNVNDLSLGASYKITQAFTAFVSAENLMARRWQLMPGIQSNTVHGLLGVELKF